METALRSGSCALTGAHQNGCGVFRRGAAGMDAGGVWHGCSGGGADLKTPKRPKHFNRTAENRFSSGRKAAASHLAPGESPGSKWKQRCAREAVRLQELTRTVVVCSGGEPPAWMPAEFGMDAPAGVPI